MNTMGERTRPSNGRAAVAIALFFLLAPVAESADGHAPAPEAPKFATGVNNPGAQWTRDPEPYAGSGLSGYLDGPRREMMCRNAPSVGWWFEPGGDFTIRKYNRLNERFYTIAGRARGCLDGPLSRARFGGIGYMHSHDVAASPDGRFIYFTEPDMSGLLRRIDFVKGEVATLSKDLRFGAMTADSKGRIYGLNRDSLSILDPDGKLVETRKMDFTGAGNVNRLFGAFMNIALDEVHNRLYAANRAPGGADWTIWCWDLANSDKFIGVLPIPKEGEPKRTLNETGPFKGTVQRCPGGISFGPARYNPDRRWLYQGGGDNTTFYRLDLDRQVIDTFGPVNPSERPPYKTLGWVHAKWLPFGSISKWCGTPTFDEEGNIYLGISLSGVITRYTRVK